MAWSNVTAGQVESWAQLSAVSDTDTDYGRGVDFQLKASEQYPVKVNVNHPLKIVESAYSRGSP
jgi:hypothetical protein